MPASRTSALPRQDAEQHRADERDQTGLGKTIPFFLIGFVDDNERRPSPHHGVSRISSIKVKSRLGIGGCQICDVGNGFLASSC
jgi:hypothetical protein